MSEWLTYQSLLLGFKNPSIKAKIISPLGGAALALTGALAAACFVKAFGITFLGMPRTSHAEAAREVSISMISGMAILAFLCLILGIFPGTVTGVIDPLSFLITGSYGIPSYQGLIFISESSAGLSPQFLLVTMVVMAIAGIVFIRTVVEKER